MSRLQNIGNNFKDVSEILKEILFKKIKNRCIAEMFWKKIDEIILERKLEMARLEILHVGIYFFFDRNSILSRQLQKY